VGKGVVAASLLPRLPLPGLADLLSLPDLQVLCGIAAVIGHCFPLWHGFRGGKGAATAVGVVCVIQPLAVVPLLLTWLAVLALSGWVGLATMVAGISLVPVFLWIGAGPVQLGFALFVALFLVFTHRSNIRKMLAGEEYRISKVMWRNWFG